MANGIRTGDPRGFNKGRSSKFRIGSRVQQKPEEGRGTYRCGNNNKDEDNRSKILKEKISKTLVHPSKKHSGCQPHKLTVCVFCLSSSIEQKTLLLSSLDQLDGVDRYFRGVFETLTEPSVVSFFFFFFLAGVDFLSFILIKLFTCVSLLFLSQK